MKKLFWITPDEYYSGFMVCLLGFKSQICDSIRFQMLQVRGRYTGGKLNIRIESTLPTIAASCVEDSFAPR
ncbi:hypothetical protein J6590_024921, partial [Homalodisca vitripennis]